MTKGKFPWECHMIYMEKDKEVYFRQITIFSLSNCHTIRVWYFHIGKETENKEWSVFSKQTLPWYGHGLKHDPYI